MLIVQHLVIKVLDKLMPDENLRDHQNDVVMHGEGT